MTDEDTGDESSRYVTITTSDGKVVWQGPGVKGDKPQPANPPTELTDADTMPDRPSADAGSET